MSLLIPPVTLSASALLAGVGCLANRGPSKVAQGREYQTGDSTFDEFFSRLFEIQLTMADAPEREQKIRERLSRKLGLFETTQTAALAKAVCEQAEQLAAAGVRLELLVIGLDSTDGATPRIELEIDAMPRDRKQRRVVRAIEQTAKAEAELLGAMRQSKATAERLRDQAPALEPAVRSVFLKQGPGKQAEVEENLRDAQRILPLLIQRAVDVADGAEATLDVLEQGTSTARTPAAPADADEQISEPPPSPARSQPKAQPRTLPKPASRPARAPAAAPAPKSAPPLADDFEP